MPKFKDPQMPELTKLLNAAMEQTGINPTTAAVEVTIHARKTFFPDFQITPYTLYGISSGRLTRTNPMFKKAVRDWATSVMSPTV